MTEIVVPQSVIDDAQAQSPTRGARKMELITAYVRDQLSEGQSIGDWRRDDQGRLVAVIE